jgi:hypothetical protein
MRIKERYGLARSILPAGIEKTVAAGKVLDRNRWQLRGIWLENSKLQVETAFNCIVRG